MELVPSPETVFLRARTRQQAMDWSLVLLSQGVSSRPAREDIGWGLWVAEADAEHARTVLDQYQRENRSWRRLTREVSGSGSWNPWVLAWVAILITGYWGQAFSPWPLEARGRMDSAAVMAGEFWRLITAVMLHADGRHLVGNVVIGALLLGLAMGVRGPGWTLLASLLGGVAGNILGWVLYDVRHLSLGASGMVMAALGLLATAPDSNAMAPPPSRHRIVRSLMATLLLFLLLGVDPGSDILAHVGGCVAGLLLGWALRQLPSSWRTDRGWNLLASATALFLAALSWALALRGASSP